MKAEKIYSRNPVTGEKYEIPKIIDDKEAINRFLSNAAADSVIVVQGLGFVGSVMSLICANSPSARYAVIGVDLATEDAYWRIGSLNEGIFPVVAEDPKIDEFFHNAINQKNFFATYDPYAFCMADVVVVDINLDVQKEEAGLNDAITYGVDLTSFRRAISAIGRYCREDVLIIIETTVPPGTTAKVVRPLIESELSKRGLQSDRFKLGHSYERVMPGPAYVDSIRRFPRVYSGIDERSADATGDFLSTLIETAECPLTRLDNTNATEIAKVLENSYRAMNIAFVAEWSRFAEEAGVNLYSVIDAIRQRPTHANLMYPGIGVGGYCLTKDPLLASWSRRNFFNADQGLIQSERAVSINDHMPLFSIEFLKKRVGSLNGRNILLLGASYRGDVGDTRYSPVERFYHGLQAENAKLAVHDPYVSFWPEVGLKVENILERVFTYSYSFQVVVISTGHSLYRQDRTIELMMALEELVIFDTIGLLSSNQISELSVKHRVIVLGRGDI